MSCENENFEVQPKPIKKKKKVVCAEQSHLSTLLLAFFLGNFGAHRFYTGHTALAVVQLLTFGGCGIWSLIDFIMICFNKFKTADELPLREYNKTVGMTFFFVWLSLWLIQFIFGFIGFFEAFMTGFKQGMGGL